MARARRPVRARHLEDHTSAFALLATVVLIISFFLVTSPSVPAPALVAGPGSQWAGVTTTVYCPDEASQQRAVTWAAQLDYRPAVFSDYLNTSDLSKLPTDTDLYSCWQDVLAHRPDANIVYTLPMVDPGFSLAAGAAGDYDNYFEGLAEQLVKYRQPDAYLRLGWEFNCGLCPNYAGKDPTDWLRYYRRIVSIMQAKSAALQHLPAGTFRFVWTVNNGINGADGTIFDPLTVYPADKTLDPACTTNLGPASPDCFNPALDYVAAIGDDIYDRSAQGVDAFRGDHGAEFWADYARRAGKPLAVGEWGVVADNPAFIDSMRAFLVKNRALFAVYSDYVGTVDSRLDDGKTPNALAAYQKDFASD